MYLTFKRLIDIIISLAAIITLLPLLLPISVVLLCTGEHYVFYRQERVGYNNKKFKIWKFSTMLKNSPNMGTGSLTLAKDPRVFPFGRFLRKTKINELPQIINVLLGNMSMVGPRPLMEVDFCRYPKHIQEIIYKTKPGITGIGSILFRDEQSIISRSKGRETEIYEKQILPYKGALEIWYQHRKSFSTDCKLLFLTAWVIVFSTSLLPYKMLKKLPVKPNFL